MTYNWQMGAPPDAPEPPKRMLPIRRRVGGRVASRGRVVTADGRIIEGRPPGTRLYVPGYHDDETEHMMMRQQLGLAIPVAPIIGAIGGKLLGKGPDKGKWNDRTKRLKAAIAAQDLTTLDLIASGYGGNWGTAYKPIERAARDAAAAIRKGSATAAAPVAAPAPAPVTLVPQIPGVVPVPVTYTPSPSAPAPEMTPPPTPAPIATADAAGGGMDLKALIIPGAVVGALLVLSNSFGSGRRSRR